MSSASHLRLAAAALAGISSACSAAPASADPPDGLTVDLVCDDGNTYTTIARAGQTWNAQLVTTSTSAFHLTRYTSTFEVTAPDGTVEVFGPSTVVKGGNDREHKDLLNCTYSFTVDLGEGYTAYIYGPATGWLTPAS
ncbi:carbon-nitrogen hydrolase family protein [Nocardioides xinjiangensis]|uniref:hypothetical protein n=1 Tax=Nocardioides xinjiangensis TaxID=2817376 RepID=UPI001B305A78|nr:hypothetical protein [Nocardioides sp. SYSU D00514]